MVIAIMIVILTLLQGGGGTKSGSQRAASSSQPVNWKHGTVSMLTVMKEDVKLVLISKEM